MFKVIMSLVSGATATNRGLTGIESVNLFRPYFFDARLKNDLSQHTSIPLQQFVDL